MIAGIHQAFLFEFLKSAVHVNGTKSEGISKNILGQGYGKVILNIGVGPPKAVGELHQKMGQFLSGRAATQVNESLQKNRLVPRDDHEHEIAKHERAGKDRIQVLSGKGTQYSVIQHDYAGYACLEGELPKTNYVARNIDIQNLARAVCHVPERTGPALLNSAKAIGFIALLPQDRVLCPFSRPFLKRK